MHDYFPESLLKVSNKRDILGIQDIFYIFPVLENLQKLSTIK